MPVFRFREMEGFSSAASAFNTALALAQNKRFAVLVHQDVYLPRDFLKRLVSWISHIEEFDPEWAVIGSIGISDEHQLAGQVWSNSANGVIAGKENLPVKAAAFDELLLVIRIDDDYRFDEGLEGFHLFGTDIVQHYVAAGRSSYIVDLPVIHYDKRNVVLDRAYTDAYKYLRSKWSAHLPIRTLNSVLNSSSTGLCWARLKRLRARSKNRKSSARLPEDPQKIARSCGWE